MNQAILQGWVINLVTRVFCRTKWSHGRWRCSTARFDLRLRTSLQRSSRRRRRRSRQRRSRNPCLRRRRRRPIPCYLLSHRPYPRNRHPGTPSRIRSFICSWPLTGGINPRRRSSAESKVVAINFSNSLTTEVAATAKRSLPLSPPLSFLFSFLFLSLFLSFARARALWWALHPVVVALLIHIVLVKFKDIEIAGELEGAHGKCGASFWPQISWEIRIRFLLGENWSKRHCLVKTF